MMKRAAMRIGLNLLLEKESETEYGFGFRGLLILLGTLFNLFLGIPLNLPIRY